VCEGVARPEGSGAVRESPHGAHEDEEIEKDEGEQRE
jgi:hypothetical protein